MKYYMLKIVLFLINPKYLISKRGQESKGSFKSKVIVDRNQLKDTLLVVVRWY